MIEPYGHKQAVSNVFFAKICYPEIAEKILVIFPMLVDLSD